MKTLNFIKFTKFSPGFQLVITISLMLFSNFLPKIIMDILYTLSVTLQEALVFFLPFLIFCCVISSIINIKNRNAIPLGIILLILVFLSNYIGTLIAYLISSLNLINMKIIIPQPNHKTILLPLWDIHFPKLLANKYFLLFGFVIGLIVSFFPRSSAETAANKAKLIISFFLERCFQPLFPLLVIGFILELQVEDLLIQSIKFCFPLLMLVSVTYILYICSLFALLAKFNPKCFFQYLKYAAPAAIMGFSTMSSLLAMPLSINAAIKNTGSRDLSCFVIPMTVNIHTIGLAINIPLIALSILSSFNCNLPSFSCYAEFAFYFVFAQFGIAAAPGCGILLMIPLLEEYLGFNNNLSALIISMYALFDPAETAANVMGNNALAILLSKLRDRYFKEAAI